MKHPTPPKHIVFDALFGGYITKLTCARCKGSIDVGALVPALDPEYWPMRDRFVAKHSRCRKGRAR